MASVLGYQAGFESTNTQTSWAPETTWAALPLAQFQAARILTDTMHHTKTRTRPPEIRGDRQSAPAITTAESASGTISFPIYYSSAGKSSPFDDFGSCLLGGVWQAPTTIVGVAGDIILTNTGGNAVVTSGTAGKFSGLSGSVGQIVKLKGFTNAVNNGFYRLSVYTSALNITLVPQGFTPVTETPGGTAANIYYSGMKNGTDFRSLYLQRRLDPVATSSKYFRYPGAYPTRGGLTLDLGQFFTASFDMVAQQELKGTADAGTGSPTTIAAPVTNDFDPVAGFKGIYWNDTLLTSSISRFNLALSNEGAAGQMALGNSLAQGMLGGTFLGAGGFSAFFRDFVLYDLFRAETQGILSIRTGDSAGNSYSFTACNAVLLFSNGVPVSGVNQSLMADVSVELNPSSNEVCTIAIDRFPSTA
jgi:hypothetical protein